MNAKKTMTFKSGPFVFSHKYFPSKIESLIVEIRILNETIKDLPILPSLSAQINQEVIKKSIFGTAAIEGNPLSEEKVAELIDDANLHKVEKNPEIEIKNLKAAYEMVKYAADASSHLSINESQIRNLHREITVGVHNQENNPGHYRNHRVHVGDKNHGGVYTPPKCLADIESLMSEYVIWLNSDELKNLYPPIRAALAHYHFGLIHPFGDGNGRTARLIEAIIIQSAGFKYTPVMLSNYYYQHIDDYFWAFSHTIKGKNYDVTHFVVFVLNALIRALNELKGRIIYFIRLFTMRDYYAYLKKERRITQRQFEFLNILLEHTRSFSLQDLFNSPGFKFLFSGVSDRTARRDLKKLEAMRLLVVNSAKQYELNLKVLG